MSEADFDPFDKLEFKREIPPGDAVESRIKRECTLGLKRRGTTSLKLRLLVTAALALISLAGILLLDVGDLHQIDRRVHAAALGILGWAGVLVAVLCIGLAQPPGKRMTWRTRMLVATSVPLVFFAYLGLVASRTVPLGEALCASTVSCGLHTLLMSAVVALGIMLPWRRTDPFNPGLTGALIGLGGGLVAAIAMGVVCPNREGWHLWLAHGVTLALVVLLSAWVGRRWLAP